MECSVFNEVGRSAAHIQKGDSHASFIGVLHSVMQNSLYRLISVTLHTKGQIEISCCTNI